MDFVTAVPESVGLSAEKLEELRTFNQGLVSSGEWPCAATLVARRGKIAFIDFAGYENVETKKLLNENSLHRIYSMTKPIIAVAVLLLVEEGKVKLSDPIGDHISEFAHEVHKVRPIYRSADEPEEVDAKRAPTVKDLLQHTAGVYSQLEQIIYSVQEQLDLWKVIKQGLLLELVCSIIASQPLHHQPGEDFVYAVQFDILGLLIERVSGTTLDMFMRERIFTPLAMTDTFFRVPKSEQYRFTQMYQQQQQENEGLTMVNITEQGNDFKCYVDDRGYLSGSEGLVSSLPDFYRFTAMLMNGGCAIHSGERLLSEESVVLMTTNQILEGGDISQICNPFTAKQMGLKGCGFGLGVSVALEPRGGLGSVGEYGWGGAATTVYFADPQEEIVVLFFTQVMHARFNMKKHLKKLVYGALIDSTAPVPSGRRVAQAESKL